MSAVPCLPLAFLGQLRQVHSTVHLTGSPTEDTKVALQSLLQPSEIDVSNTARDSPMARDSPVNNLSGGCGWELLPRSMSVHAVKAVVHTTHIQNRTFR